MLFDLNFIPGFYHKKRIQNFLHLDNEEANKKLKTIKDAPKELITYLKFIESFTNRKIKIISYGPERNQTLIL